MFLNNIPLGQVAQDSLVWMSGANCRAEQSRCRCSTAPSPAPAGPVRPRANNNQSRLNWQKSRIQPVVSNLLIFHTLIESGARCQLDWSCRAGQGLAPAKFPLGRVARQFRDSSVSLLFHFCKLLIKIIHDYEAFMSMQLPCQPTSGS